MKIELYTFVYNDEDFLPFFIKHYTSIVDKMTFIDSGSTDSTLELLRDYEVIQTGLTWWDWDALHEIRNSIWRDSEYNLVFFPDVDEIFYKENLREWLENNIYDIYQMEGFQMVSKSFPKRGSNIIEIKKGIPLSLHNKYTIFNPLVDFTFTDAHNVKTTSKKINRFDIKLLHYKYLGVTNMVRRTKLIIDRVPIGSYCKNIDGNILVKFSAFIETEQKYKTIIDQMLKKAKVVI